MELFFRWLQLLYISLQRLVDNPSWSDPRCLLVSSMGIWEWPEWQPKKNQLWTLDCQTDFTNMLPRWQVVKHIETTGLEGSRQPLSLNQNGSQPTLLVLVQCDSSFIELLQVQQIQSRTYASRKMFPSRKCLEFRMSKSPPPESTGFRLSSEKPFFSPKKTLRGRQSWSFEAPSHSVRGNDKPPIWIDGL